MKRFSTVLLLLLSFAAVAQTTAPALPETARVANVLVVDNDAWRTDLAVVAPDGAAIGRISDCPGFGGGGTTTYRLPNAGGVFVPDLSRYQCSHAKLGVVKLPIIEGSPRLWTQAHYKDASGNTNVVMLPVLPDSLPLSDEGVSPEAPRRRAVRSSAEAFIAEYVFDGVENASSFGRSTFVALIPDGERKTNVELTLTSYANTAESITETVTVDGFTFYELTTPVDFARLTIRHVAPPDYDGPAPGLFAVAFIGERSGGSPRVEIPHTRFSVSAE